MKDAAGTGDLISATVAIRPLCSILVEVPGETGPVFGDVLVGETFVDLAVVEGHDWLFGGCDGVCGRCGYDGRAVRSLRLVWKGVLPYDAERLKELVLRALWVRFC